MADRRIGDIGRFAARAMAGLALALVAISGCSSGAAPLACDSSQCLTGNRCIAAAGAPSQCRFPCATHTDCPFNYHCDANAGGTSPYCAPNTLQFPDKPGSQFGAPCSPTGGFQNNPACDSTDGFWCNASSPLDANAFCTYFGCKADTDCGGGFYCGKVNEYPNASTAQLQNGETLAACLPRGYCAPCSSDIDCAPADAAPQHCIAGTDGATFCAHECSQDSECDLDAKCAPQENYSACTPRAGVCKGDGSLCSPCRSDADCTNGFCVPAYNSPERFCSSKSGVTCSYTSSLAIVDQCPTTTTATSNISCSVPSVEPNMPANQCIGQVQEGLDDSGQPSFVPGCWSLH